MKRALPNGHEAVVDIEKLRSYCLNTSHPRGRHKARVFASALGLTVLDAFELRSVLLEAAATGEAVSAEADDYGARYFMDFEMTRGERRATVRSTWIVLAGEVAPRLTSCYVL